MGELTRAEVVDNDAMPTDVVGMHSRVECVDENSGERHTLTLVFPHEADAGAGRISIMAPVGCALLGLSVGQSIDWNTPQGRPLKLGVTDAHPAAAGSGRPPRHAGRGRLRDMTPGLGWTSRQSRPRNSPPCHPARSTRRDSSTGIAGVRP